MQRVVPALRVKTFETSREFYAGLGFSVAWTHQHEPGLPVFASLQRDSLEIYLTEHTGDCAFGGLVHFYVDDVDACYREFKERGIQIDRPPGNSLGPHIRDMLVVDPDGNRLSFLTVSGSGK